MGHGNRSERKIQTSTCFKIKFDDDFDAGVVEGADGIGKGWIPRSMIEFDELNLGKNGNMKHVG